MRLRIYLKVDVRPVDVSEMVAQTLKGLDVIHVFENRLKAFHLGSDLQVSTTLNYAEIVHVISR